MTKRATTVPISERALVARINRQLNKEDQQLRKCRPDQRGYGELGDFYIVGDRTGVEAQHVDIERLGKELGVLKPYEKLDD